jgi:ribosome recycling factor
MMESVDDVLLTAEEKMEKCIEHLNHEFSALRTGKASPALVDGITVPYYGTPTRLKELANISTPEPRLIVVSPFDPSVLSEIEKAILGANLGITPLNDGRVVRVPIPELSEERRGEMTKVAKRMSEESRVAIRNVRRDANDSLKALEKSSKITEDDCKGGLEQIQKATDKCISDINVILSAKEKEMMQV